MTMIALAREVRAAEARGDILDAVCLRLFASCRCTMPDGCTLCPFARALARAVDIPVMGKHRTTPAVVVIGAAEMQSALGTRVRAELASGTVLRVVHLLSGYHRAWLAASTDPGHEVTRVSCHQLAKHIGRCLDQVRDGAVFEIFDYRAGRVLGYLTWCAPRSVSELDVATAYVTRARRGTAARTLRGEFESPNATSAAVA